MTDHQITSGKRNTVDIQGIYGLEDENPPMQQQNLRDLPSAVMDQDDTHGITNVSSYTSNLLQNIDYSSNTQLLGKSRDRSDAVGRE